VYDTIRCSFDERSEADAKLSVLYVAKKKRRKNKKLNTKCARAEEYYAFLSCATLL